jgi:dGTPase
VPLYKQNDKVREFNARTRGKRREPFRTEFRKDYGRLIHSCAFRRLVGKTQLFPGSESDFFRNRLTHSLEVAQIAKSIAIKLNYEHKRLFGKTPIDTDLVETAALAHDLGHPPFGHIGEAALDERMLNYGGFEGNAQTLRILARTEKKVTSDSDGNGITANGDDLRFGLNPCFRTLAATLKYDTKIPLRRRPDAELVKGYYESEAELVSKIKIHVSQQRIPRAKKFKTIECRIMDLADDIAYSTYDIEDALKAGFLTPLDFITPRESLLMDVHREINKDRKKAKRSRISVEDIRLYLLSIFSDLLDNVNIWKLSNNQRTPTGYEILDTFANLVTAAKDLSAIGYFRTQVTSDLVQMFIDGIQFKFNRSNPPLSQVYFDPKIETTVEVLKRFAYVSLIQHTRLRFTESRGKEIVFEIFDHLNCKNGQELLPSDFRTWYERSDSKTKKMRVICDYIAGMTDRYAVEFYNRLKSEHPLSIFKPT